MTPPASPRVIHLTACRRLSAGQRKQIGYERAASAGLETAAWESIVVHDGPCIEPFERRTPFPFRSIFLRTLYAWVVALRLSRRCDYLLMRHMNFDCFVFAFAPLISNRVSVHHAKEVEELPLIRPGLLGRVAAVVEGMTGRFGVRRALGVLGVTREIAEYERDTRSPATPCSAFPNGIDVSRVSVASDHRMPDQVHIAFICGTFTAWHGLDRLVAAVQRHRGDLDDVVIHLIGRLSPAQRAQLAALGDKQTMFRIHGFLQPDAYDAILARCDAGLGSLAMDRQNLREGATLKVREMLAIGLPVYSGHRDTALPEAFPYYRVGHEVEIAALRDFAVAMKQHSRQRVRETAAPFIDKLGAMRRVVEWLDSLGTSRVAIGDPRIRMHGSAMGAE